MNIARLPVTFEGGGGRWSAEIEHNLGEELVIVQLYRKETGRWHPEQGYIFSSIDANRISVTTGQRWGAYGMPAPTSYEWSIVIVA